MVARDGRTVITPAGEAVLTNTILYDGPGYEVARRLPHRQVGPVIGTVQRRRHTYRTTYAYTRIGYDREHWCWWGDVQVPGRHVPALTCYPTLGEVVGLMLREEAKG